MGCTGCSTQQVRLDLFAFSEDSFSPVEVDISRRDVFQALVEVTVVVVIDEGVDLPF